MEKTFRHNDLRKSNFELLRLVAMFFIICHHLVIRSAQTCGYTHPFNINEDVLGGGIGLVANSLAVCGVNLFLLISGWFGVKRIWSQIVRLIVDCVIYCLIANLLCIFVFGYPFSWHELFFSCNFLNNWFVTAFIMFLLMIPLVERALENIDIKTLGKFIILLTVFNVLFGYCVGVLNTNGYNAINFVYLYVIGRYLRYCSSYPFYKKWASHGYILWLLCVIPLVIGFLLLTHFVPWQESLSQKYFGYNNPFVLLSSVGLFLSFSVIQVHSLLINKLAKGVFGVFLLHTTSIFIYYRVTYIRTLYEEHGYVALLVVALLIFVIGSFIALFVENFKSLFVEKIGKQKKGRRVNSLFK